MDVRSRVGLSGNAIVLERGIKIMDEITIRFDRIGESENQDAGAENGGGISLRADSVSGHQINLSYQTITGNCPQTFGNKLHIWKSDGVKWGSVPFRTYDLPNDDEDGQIYIQGLNIGKNSFTIGYSVGPDPDQAAASVTISQDENGGLEYRYGSCRIEMTAVNDTSVSFSYQTVEGYTPKEHQAFVAIWERKRVPYPGKNEIALAQIDCDNDQGTGIIGQLNLASGQDYCLGLFLPGDGLADTRTYLAASCTFQY